MRFLYALTHRLEALQHVPEIGNFGTFLGKLVLDVHSFDCGIEQVGIAERHIQHGFQRAERGQRNYPVAENSVMYRLLFHLGGQFPFYDGIGVRKVLLEQLPVIQYLYGHVCQSQVAQGYQIFIAAFLLLAERGLGKSEKQDTGVECHILRGLVLSAKHHARTDYSLCRHTVRTRVFLCLATASPKTFQISNLTDVEIVLVLVKYHERIDRL
ncbi:unknown [Bacteroides sp. CAG:462]|nr:unknown [Bacteroides sp. CAG:462]